MRGCCRDVAQLGSALLWGSRGRGFESRRSDPVPPRWRDREGKSLTEKGFSSA
jgi:hypothetical protein